MKSKKIHRNQVLYKIYENHGISIRTKIHSNTRQKNLKSKENRNACSTIDFKAKKSILTLGLLNVLNKNFSRRHFF